MKRIPIAIIACLLLASCSNGPSTSTLTGSLDTITPVATPTPLNTYGSTCVKEEIDNLNRADLWAIVPNADTLSEDDIKECMQSIIKKYTVLNKVTAVTLYLADTTEDVERSSYTLGRCTYYPSGDIANAVTTTPGEYSNFIFKYEINSRADKEAPTDLEVEIYDYVNNELDKGIDEDTVDETAAKKYNISIDELNLIWNKVYTYKH